jgi:hypothetical protein
MADRWFSAVLLFPTPIKLTATIYSGWPKVFVKYGVGNMENKARRQRNANFAYIL